MLNNAVSSSNYTVSKLWLKSDNKIYMHFFIHPWYGPLMDFWSKLLPNKSSSEGQDTHFMPSTCFPSFMVFEDTVDNFQTYMWNNSNSFWQ